jgi:hypothetical protein
MFPQQQPVYSDKTGNALQQPTIQTPPQQLAPQPSQQGAPLNSSFSPNNNTAVLQHHPANPFFADASKSANGSQLTMDIVECYDWTEYFTKDGSNQVCWRSCFVILSYSVAILLSFSDTLFCFSSSSRCLYFNCFLFYLVYLVYLLRLVYLIFSNCSLIITPPPWARLFGKHRGISSFSKVCD